MESCSYVVVAIDAMIRFCFFVLTYFLSISFCTAQINFSRYLDEGSVPIFDPSQHLDIKIDWKMSGKVQLHMNEGLNYLEEGNYDLSLTNLDEVLKIDSVFWQAYYYKGVVYRKLYKAKEAEVAFRHAIRLNPNQPQAYVELGKVSHGNRKLNNAEVYYKKAIAIDPKLAAGYFGLATLELTRGEMRKATRLYSQCIEVDSSFAEAYVILGVLKFRDKKKNTESIALLDAAVNANPKYTHSYFWRGYLHLMLDSPEKCLADWSTYINFNPSNTFMLMMRGFLQIEMDRFDEAFIDLRKAFLSRTLDEEGFKGAQTLLDKQIDLQAATQYLLRTGYGLKEETLSYVKRGYCLMISGRSKEALDELQRAEKVEPAPVIFLLQGIAFEHINNHPLAYRNYERALLLDDDIFDAHKKRAIYRIELKDWPGADQDIRAMMRLMPDSKIPYRFRGFAKSHQGDYRGAIEDLTKYIESDSLDAESFRTRSVCRAQLGDLKGANDDLFKVLKFQPNNWRLYSEVEKNYLTLNDTTKAIEVVKLHAQRNSGIHDIQLQLVRLYIAQKRWKEAQQSLDETLPAIKKVYVAMPMPSVESYYSEALGLLAQIHFASGNFAAVIEECSEALKLNKSNLASRYLRALSYEKVGDKKNARADFKILSNSGYKDSEALYKKLQQEK